MNFWKKLIVVIVFISMITSLIGSIVIPREVQATWPTMVAFSIPNLLKWIWEAVKLNWAEIAKVYRDAIVIALIKIMEKDVINSINNGGSPNFVSNWGGFMKKAGDITFNQFNEYLSDSRGIDLCAPFKSQLKLSFAAHFGNESGFSGLPVACNFDEFKQNLENSIDFVSEGGWLAYNQIFLPENNYFGMSLELEDAYNNKANEKKQERENESQASGGFLGQKECIKYGGGYTKDSIASFCVENEEDVNNVAACEKTVTEQWCDSWQTTTPGDLIGKAAGEAIGGDNQVMANVQSAISSIVAAGVNKLLETGMSKMTDSSWEEGKKYGAEHGQDGGIPNFNKEEHKTDIEDGIAHYQDFIEYSDDPFLPTINRGIDIITSKNLEACSSSTINIDEGGGNNKDYLIADIIEVLQSSKQTFESVRSEAVDNKAELNNLLSQQSPSLQDINAALIKLSSYLNKYQTILTDIETMKAGQDGSMYVLLNNIVVAISGYSCPAQ